jgi:hypothetical protein
MRAATLAGTGSSAARAPGAWALKTGTAEVPALSQAGSPAGTAAWIVGFPTTPTRSGVLPVIAGVVLPGDDDLQRSGPRDGVALINTLAGAAMSVSDPDAECG